MEEIKKVSNKKVFGTQILVFLCSFVYFYYLCVQLRFLTGDEGYFAYSAKAVAMGQTPYKDFFFPQAPLFPYFLAFWQQFFGESFFSYRLFICFVISLISTLTFSLIFQKRKEIFIAVFGVLIFSCFDLVIAYFTIIKNYALTTLFLLVSVYFYNLKFKYKYILVGFFLALSAQIRSYSGLLGFVYLVHILYFEKFNKKEIIFHLMNFFLGCFIGLIPTFIFLIFYPQEFIFNNLLYHSLRNSSGLIGKLPQKFRMFTSLFTTYIRTGSISPQFMLLVLFLLAKKNNFKSIYFHFSIVLFIISFLPTPAYVQYLVMITPFLIIYIFEDNNFYQEKHLKFLSPIRSIIMLIFLLFFFEEFPRYLITGEGVSGLHTRREVYLWRTHGLDNKIKELSNYIDENKGGKDVSKAIVSWPGYLIGLNVKAKEGMENHFARTIAHKLTDEEKIKYKVYYSPKEIEDIIDRKEVDLIILGYRDKGKKFRTHAKKAGYNKKNFSSVILWSNFSVK